MCRIVCPRQKCGKRCAGSESKTKNAANSRVRRAGFHEIQENTANTCASTAGFTTLSENTARIAVCRRPCFLSHSHQKTRAAGCCYQLLPTCSRFILCHIPTPDCFCYLAVNVSFLPSVSISTSSPSFTVPRIISPASSVSTFLWRNLLTGLAP